MNGEKLEAFPPIWWSRQESPLSPFAIIIALGVTANAISQEKKFKSIQTGKKEENCYCLSM